VVSAEERSEVWVASFPKARELPQLDGSTTWWRFFMRLSAEYGHLSAMIAGDLLIPESERRLAAVLLKFGGFRVLGNPGVDDVSAAAPVLVPVTQAELPAAANLSRNSAGKILQVLGRRRMVETGYRGITITHPAGLLSVVESRDGWCRGKETGERATPSTVSFPQGSPTSPNRTFGLGAAKVRSPPFVPDLAAAAIERCWPFSDLHHGLRAPSLRTVEHRPTGEQGSS
jgi:hypothetical protein